MNKAMYKQIPLSELEEIVKNSKTLGEVLKKIGYVNASSSTKLKEYLIENNIDFSHFPGSGWKRKEHNEQINEFNTSNHNSIKNILIKERGAKCEKCKNTHWLGELIPLELHHINGDSSCELRSNLLLLCPNCHALTNNFRGRHKTNTYVSDELFLQALKETDNIHQACKKLGIDPNQSNYARARLLLSQNNIQEEL